MNEPLLIERQRLVLRELARLKADKAKSEAALAETLKSRKESAAKLQKNTLAQLETRFQQETAAAKAESEQSRQSLLAHFAKEHPVAAQEYEAIKETSEDQYQDAKEKIRKEHEEYRWTTGTVFEASEKKIQAPFQAIQQQVTAAMQRAKDLRAEGEEVLKLWRQGSLASGKKFAGKPDRHHADPQRNLKASLAEGEELLAELKALRVPRAFQGLRLLWAFLALWAVFAISLFFLYPSGLVGGKYHWLAVATGFAFLIELALAALLYVSARFKARDVYRPMCFALADAEVTSQAWLQKAQAAYQEQLNKLEQEKKQRDEKLEQAKERYRQVKANLRERRDRALTQAEEKYPKLLASLVHNRDEGLRQAEEKYRRQLLLNKERLEKERRQTDENLQRELAACDQEQTQTKQAIMQNSLRGLAKVRNLINEVLGECGQLFPPWQHPSWNEWSSPADAPSVLRFGEYELGLREQVGDLFGGGRWPQEMPNAVAVPALLQFPERCSMLWRTRDAGRAAAVASMQGTMFRFLTTLPAGKVRFTIIDPVGLGENFSSFMHLADYDEQLVASRIWTEGQHIEQRLADIAAHMENVIQKYLRNQFASIQEYNAQAGEVAEPFRVLVVANFPTNFTPDAARRLLSIAASGASCGVYTLVSVDTAQPMPSGFNLADLEQSSVTLSWKDQRFIWKEPDFESFPLKLDSAPDDEMLNRVLRTVGQEAREANRVEVPFDFIAPKPAEWWQSSSKSGIDVPLGRAGATKRQHLRLGKGTSQHVLIAGKTGSGKSTLLHALITNLSLLYSPDEVELYLVDFKKGVEFKTYVTHQLPHARVVAVESEREFGLSVLQRLDAELKQRGDRFRSLGVQNLSDFRDTSPDICPRILLIVDEFQEFFVEDDKIAQESALLLDRLVRQGRAFGLHILLGSQTLGGAYSLARSTIDQMAVRIALQCSEADGHLILSKDNSAARLLTRPGEAIYNDANGLVEGNDIFQVVWLPDERREELLEETNKLNQEREHIRRSQIVFEGNTPADLRKNTLFANLLDRPSWPESSASFSAWLGDAIAIKDPTAAVFVRQTCSNLLLVGHQEEAGLSILTTTLLGLGCQVPPLASDGLPSFTILDSIAADSTHAGCWDALARVLPQTMAIGAWRDVPAKLGEIAAEVDRRLKTNEAESPPLFLFVHGLQRFKDLRKQDDDFGFSRREDKALPPSKLLEHILREGPAVGVHALIWCDTLTNVQRAFDRQTMRDFGMRVLFQMSPNDSSTLIDSPAAGKLGLHRALFCSEDLGTIEKFRPYGLLDEEWVAEVGRRLREKSVPTPASADVGT